MNIKTVMVIGSGLMGSGIAQVCAQSGFSVFLSDISKENLEKALKNIRWSAGKMVEKGKVEGSLDDIMNRINISADYEPAAGADIIIEAVFENLELKRGLFSKVDKIAPEHAIMASNTSAIPITELAAGTGRPDRVLGLHFFSPVPMMQAVEVIRGISTSGTAFLAGRDFVRRLGKEPIMVNMDIPGFIINRINLPSAIEAMRLVEAGVASIEDIDMGLRLAAGRRMGVFETGDMVGLDVTLGALTAMYEETKDSRWFPPMILRRKVRAGHLGRKTGKGWYEYDPEGNKIKFEGNNA